MVRHIRKFSLLWLPCLLYAATDNPAAAEEVLADLDPYEGTEYVIRLTNGDIITGTIEEFVTSEDGAAGVDFFTETGTQTIFEDQIIEIVPRADYYRHDHRIFIMPTANAIRNNHFAGAFELMMLYGGAGIGKIVSVTAGRSFLPTVPSNQQLTVINAKATLFTNETEFAPGNSVSLALGGNLTFLNDANRLLHFYSAATFIKRRTSITGIVYYKAGSEDIYTVRAGDRFDPFTFSYADGSFGVGAGIDTKFSQRHDWHFIGEIWNSDVTRPSNTAVLLGFRLANSSVSADFGIAVFTQPAVAPFTSFVWTPF